MNVILTKSNLAAAAAAAGDIEESAVAPAGSKPDDTVARILKLVPSEVVAAYTALLAIASAAVPDATVRYAVPVAIVVCSVLIVLLIRRAADTNTPPVTAPRLQYVASMLAFWAWAFSIRDPLAGFGYYTPAWIPAFAMALVPMFGGFLVR